MSGPILLFALRTVELCFKSDGTVTMGEIDYSQELPIRYLSGCSRDDKVPGNATPVTLAKFGEAHEKQAMLLLCPRNALSSLGIISALQLLLQTDT